MEISRESLNRLSKEDLIIYFLAETEILKKRIHELESQIKKDSHNSSKPPSSDGFKKKPKTKSLRKKSKKKPGGQKGHKGHTLNLVEAPDETIIHSKSDCDHCHKALTEDDVLSFERRQVFDIPEPRMQVTEHQACTSKCPHCGTVNHAKFPEQASYLTQYGVRTKALVTYLQNFQLIPYERICDLIEDLYGCRLSKGTLYNYAKHCYRALEFTEDFIKQSIQASPVAHFDETGIYSKDKRKWLHGASTEHLTFYAMHEKRGSIAMDSINILPDFKGVAVHDFWSAYLKYDSKHSLCNAHHLRELTYLYEVENQVWAGRMMKLLVEIKEAVDQRKCSGKSSLDVMTINRFVRKYNRIRNAGLKESKKTEVAIINKPKKRGRKKQTKAKNLLDRFKKYNREILYFMNDFQVPFDNNQAERDIRMMKVKQKISGCFRSDEGAKFFCRIRGYISTARKNDINVFKAIQDALNGNPFLPIPDG